VTARAARMRREIGRIGRFSLTGVANTLVDMAVFATLALGLGFAPVAANLVAYTAGVSNSYVLNRYWTFRGDAPTAMGARRVALFFGLNTLVATAATGALYLLIRAGAPTIAAKVLSVFFSMGLNYAAMRGAIFVDCVPAEVGRGTYPARARPL